MRLMLPRLLLSAAWLLTVSTVPRAHAYTLTGAKWAGSSITMQLQLGAPGGPLSDGSASWGAVAEDALGVWNGNIGAVKFNVVRDSTAARSSRNRLNNVFFSADVYGQAWGSGVLAVTLISSIGSSTSETDVLFNANLSWNSYRGSLRAGVHDFRRVAMHEFGHVLGLDHPDEAGQIVSALMNSHISSLDTVTGDDIAGAQSLYGAAASTPPPAPTTPPPPPAVAAPVITAQPASLSVTAGQGATFSVGASSTASMSYQWRKNGLAIGGANAASFTIAATSSADAGGYTVVVSNSGGSVTSNTATLTVNAATTPPPPISVATAPSIVTQPASQVVVLGGTATFPVVAAGTAPLYYQWWKDGVALAGATNAALTLTNVQPADAGSYRVVVTNSAGAANSSAVTLTVNSAPRIDGALPNQSVAAGEAITLTVSATGSPAPTYQWLKDGVEIPGATAATLSIARSTPSDGGVYAVRVTNSAGSLTSAGAVVVVRFSRLMNLSTRGLVPIGGALTPGFTLRGAGAKSLVIRAVGPTLSLFGIGTALTETHLDVLAPDATIVASNNNWGGSAALSTAFARVGAFPLAADSKDAAVQASLAPQAYTVRVAPTQPGTSGVTLAEIYDADATTTTRLVNLSTLGFVGAGEDVLTAGFVVSGTAPKRLLLRAVGPGLAPFGVSTRLADPQLSLVPLGALPLASNDDWPDIVSVQSAFNEAGAFALTRGSKDAALVITLEPGAYTVVVSGTGTNTGNALVEIYDLDP